MRLATLLVAVLAVASCSDPADHVADGATTSDGGAVRNDAGATSDASTDDGQPTEGGLPASAFSVVVLPDTQFYAQVYPEFFDKQTQWIVDHKNELNIAFVVHEGDIVNDEEKRQWENAAHSLHLLDGVVPYVLTAGNHDIIDGSRSAPMMNQFFPVSSFMANPWFKGTFEPNKIQNNFQIFPAGGQMWLVIALEFGPRDEVLAWAQEILAKYPTTPAIIVTHAYMYLNDERYDHVKYPPAAQKQYWGPHDYMLAGSSNDGEEMWQKLVSQAPNVQLVLSGHVPYPYSVSRLRSERADGTHVHQMLANFQGCFNESAACVDAMGMRTMGGWGYLRILTIDPSTHGVSVKTFSPVRNEYLTDPANQFELTLD